MSAHDDDSQSRADLAREHLSHGDRLSSPYRRQRGRRAIPLDDPLPPDETDWDDPLVRRNIGWQERSA